MAKDNDSRFIKLRQGLLEHLKMGWMYGCDLAVYVALHYHADYQTGVVYHKSAPYFSSLLRLSTSKVQRSLRRLEDRGYIKRFGHRGQVSGYDIIINKYAVQLKCKSNATYSQLKCILILADKSKSLNEIGWTVNEPCNLKIGQKEVKCELGVIQVSSIIELKTIRLLDYNNSKGKKSSKSKSFTPPTPKEVKEYAESIDFPEIDADYFCRYYEANNWKLKNDSKMRSWKQAVAYWKKTEKEKHNGSRENRYSSAADNTRYPGNIR